MSMATARGCGASPHRRPAGVGRVPRLARAVACGCDAPVMVEQMSEAGRRAILRTSVQNTRSGGRDGGATVVDAARDGWGLAAAAAWAGAEAKRARAGAAGAARRATADRGRASGDDAARGGGG